MAVGEIGVEEAVEEEEALHVRLGRPALADLGDERLFRPLHARARDGRGGHPVGLQPEGEGQLVGRDGLVKIGLVERCVGVELPPDPLNVIDVLHGGDVLGPLEHEVFHEVGEARLPGLFPDGAGGVGDDDRDHRKGIVLGEDDLEAVLQAILGQGEIEALGDGGLAGEARDAEQDGPDPPEDGPGHGHFGPGACGIRALTIA